MGTSVQRMRADHQHEPDDFDADARHHECDAWSIRGEQRERREHETPTRKQKRKTKQPHLTRPPARGLVRRTRDIVHG